MTVQEARAVLNTMQSQKGIVIAMNEPLTIDFKLDETDLIMLLALFSSIYREKTKEAEE